MKGCKEIGEFIHAYIDKEATHKETLLVEEHLKNCTVCLNKIASLSILKKTLKEKVVFKHAPNSLKEKVLNIPQTQSLISLPLRWAVGFAVVIVLLIGGIHFYQTRIPYLSIKDNSKVTQHLKDCKNCKKESVKLVREHVKILGQYVSLQTHLDNCPGCRKSIIDKSLKHIQELTLTRLVYDEPFRIDIKAREKFGYGTFNAFNSKFSLIWHKNE